MDAGHPIVEKTLDLEDYTMQASSQQQQVATGLTKSAKIVPKIVCGTYITAIAGNKQTACMYTVMINKNHKCLLGNLLSPIILIVTVIM